MDNDLYRGGHPSCAGLARLERLGVRTFIDLGGAGGAFHHCKSVRNGTGIQVYHVKLSLADITLLGISDEKLRSIFALMQKSPKPVFLSCSLGRDRTGVITALYRLNRGEMSFAEAQDEAIYYGYRPHFIGLRKALDRYRDPQELKLLPAPAPYGSAARERVPREIPVDFSAEVLRRPVRPIIFILILTKSCEITPWPRP